MPDARLVLHLAAPAETARLGRHLSEHLRRGDTLLLEGPIGAGKTHLARAVIQARLGRSEEVPSPTFTLVQTYDAGIAEIWHADLFRLTRPDEAVELGLDEAMEREICLIEWPERLGTRRPPDALTVRIDLDGEARSAVLTGPLRWSPVLDALRRVLHV